MRKPPQIRAGSEDGILLNRAIEMLAELRSRVEQLEAEIYGYRTSKSPSSSSVPKVRNGRRPKLEGEVLLKRRISLTAWLEQNWPRLSIPLRKAEASRNASEAVGAIIAARKFGIPGVFQPPFYDAPENFYEALRSFLDSGRFRGNPRNLAAAMAGLPELSWKRSFDICTAYPHKSGQMLQVYWDHMRRKFPDRLRELEAAESPSQVEIVLARSRTTDPVYLHLKENPERVKAWLDVGRPQVRSAREKQPADNNSMTGRVIKPDSAQN